MVQSLLSLEPWGQLLRLLHLRISWLLFRCPCPGSVCVISFCIWLIRMHLAWFDPAILSVWIRVSVTRLRSLLQLLTSLLTLLWSLWWLCLAVFLVQFMC